MMGIKTIWSGEVGNENHKPEHTLVETTSEVQGVGGLYITQGKDEVWLSPEAVVAVVHHFKPEVTKVCAAL
jgi:hypothetical protein